MHKMSFEVKRTEPVDANAGVWPTAMLIAVVTCLAWVLEPALIHMWMR